MISLGKPRGLLLSKTLITFQNDLRYNFLDRMDNQIVELGSVVIFDLLQDWVERPVNAASQHAIRVEVARVLGGGGH